MILACSRKDIKHAELCANVETFEGFDRFCSSTATF